MKKKKKITHLKVSAQRNFFQQLVLSFADFQQNNSLIMQKTMYKKYHL